MLIENFLDSADLTIFQAYFNPVRMRRRIRQYISDNSARSSPCSLILLQNNFDCNACFYIFSVLTIHIIYHPRSHTKFHKEKPINKAVRESCTVSSCPKKSSCFFVENFILVFHSERRRNNVRFPKHSFETYRSILRCSFDRLTK